MLRIRHSRDYDICCDEKEEKTKRVKGVDEVKRILGDLDYAKYVVVD